MPAERLSRLACLATLATLLACESRVLLGGECVEEASCASELACRFGRCRAECTQASECTAGAICVGTPGVCTLVTDTCTDSCASGLVCADGRCTSPCSEVTPCRAGSLCRTLGSVRACVADDGRDAGVDAPSMDTGLEPDASQPPDAREAPDAALPPLPAGRTLCAGYSHACAVRDGRVYCWGNNDAHQLGDGPDPSTRRSHGSLCGGHDCAASPDEPVRRSSGTSAVELTGVTEIACGHHTTCALTSAGLLYCWGSNANGYELGHDGLGTVGGPTLLSGVTDVVVGREHGCARVGDHFECWGSNEADLRGTPVEIGTLGSAGPSSRMAREATRLADARFVSTGADYTCAVTAAEVRCVGINYIGELGYAEVRVDSLGHAIAGLVHPIEALHTMDHAVCALADGDVSCWGADFAGILAPQDEPPVCEDWAAFGYRCRASAAPVRREVDLLGERFVGLSTGLSSSACAIVESDRSIVCWGDNVLGQAGVTSGATAVGILAEHVSLESDGSRLTDVAEVSCGAAFCCARTRSARVFCWGENDAGQLGNGTTDSETYDAAVPDDGGVVAVGHPLAVEVSFP